jgi:hypothetical protein
LESEEQVNSGDEDVLENGSDDEDDLQGMSSAELEAMLHGEVRT